MQSMDIIDSSWHLASRDERAIAWEDEENQQWQQTRMEAYAGTIDHVDAGIGDLVDALKERMHLITPSYFSCRTMVVITQSI